MKYKQIILFFLIALPVSLALRFIQLFYIVEANTGFYKQGFEVWGGCITAIIIAVVAISALFTRFSHRSPEKPPQVRLSLGISSGILAFVTAIELIFGGHTFGTIQWQKSLLYLFGIAFVIWLTVYAIKDFINIKLPSIAAIIPCFYFIVKIICSFAGVSSLALISDNVILTFAYCAILLFMLNLAKAYNGIDTERGFRKLLASGLASVLLCTVQSVPNIVFHLANEEGYLHTAMVTNFAIFFTGVFISAFIFSHFSYKNSCE